MFNGFEDFVEIILWLVRTQQEFTPEWKNEGTETIHEERGTRNPYVIVEYSALEVDVCWVNDNDEPPRSYDAMPKTHYIYLKRYVYETRLYGRWLLRIGSKMKANAIVWSAHDLQYDVETNPYNYGMPRGWDNV